MDKLFQENVNCTNERVEFPPCGRIIFSLSYNSNKVCSTLLCSNLF